MMSNVLIERAKKVLLNNHQKGGFTIPTEKLYPFQWMWDSGFIALGFAHFDIEKAKSEINNLLSAQWGNGFIPHIVFHTKADTYFPGPDFFQSELSEFSSKKFKTSGITQPPVFGFVLEKIYEIVDDKKDFLKFIKTQIDKVYFNHVYFYENRDVNNEGLAYIYHNWESGTDNSPLWDTIWGTMNPPDYKFERKDTNHVDSTQRPTKREYDHYIHLLEIAKNHKYDDKKIAEFSPFLVQDPLFNAILLKSNQSLINLYSIIGGEEKKIEYLENKNRLGVDSLNKKLYDSKLGAYVYYDLRNSKKLKGISSSSFSPLFCGAPDERISKQLEKTFNEKFSTEDKYICASFDTSSESFNPKKYWRGPVWLNLNWILFHGFNEYGLFDISKRIKKDSIDLIENEGFYEYFDPTNKSDKNKKRACGSNNFSWTAALYLDFYKRETKN